MQLNIKHLEIKELLGYSNLSHYVSNDPSNNLLGVFDHFSGLTRFYFEKSWPGIFPNLKDYINYLEDQTKHISDFNDKLSELLKRTAFFHEIRHFHDCFCTPKGVKLLDDYLMAYGLLQCLIQEIIKFNGLANYSIEFPIKEYFKKPEAPKALQGLWEAAQGLLLEIALDIGSTPITQFEGHDLDTDFIIITYNDKLGIQYRIPCVIINVLIDNNRCHYLWPVGFCLITECLAILEQVYYLNAIDGALTNEFYNRLKQQGVSPYLPLLATFTRIFRRHGYDATETYPIYDCLARSLFTDNKFNNYSERDIGVGWEIIRLLENHLFLENGTVKWNPPKLNRNKLLKKSKKINALPMAFGEYVRNSYLKKALKISERKNIDYTSQLGYTLYFGELPRLPLVLTLEGELSIDDPNFYMLWLNWILYQEVVHSAFFDNMFICPVRNQYFKLIFRHEYLCPEKEGCARALSEYNCGLWKPPLTYEAPRCAWTHYIEVVLNPFGLQNEKIGKTTSPWKPNYTEILRSGD